jgi:hypothetical protein
MELEPEEPISPAGTSGLLISILGVEILMRV